MTCESRYVDADGVRTHYLEQGDGPPLVLVHGGGAGADSLGNWRDCIGRYAEQFHVLALDMIGFGRSARPDPRAYAYNRASRSRHLAAFIETVVGGPASVIGNSMGGATALGVAIERPELIHKLVLMGSAGIAVDNPDPSVKKILAGYDFTPEGMRRIVESLTAPGYAIDEELILYRHGLTISDDSRAALRAMGESIRAEGLAYDEALVATVKTPTLIVGGKADRVAISARNYRFLDLLENSWGFFLPHCGHWVMMESPEEFVAVTRQFLASGLFRAPA